MELQANCAVCKADDSGATALSSAASCKDLYGTQCIGIYSKIRSWKSVSNVEIICSLPWSISCSFFFSPSSPIDCMNLLKGGNPSNAGKADGTRVFS